jgi:hypothetical protein
MAGNLGLTQQEAKNIIVGMGFASTKAIKIKDYEAVCAAIEKAAEGKNHAE